MEPLAGVPLVALAVVMLGAVAWAFMTTDRRAAWALTAASLWAGAACFTVVGLVSSSNGEPAVVVLLGWMLTVAGLVTAATARAGRFARPLRRASVATAGARQRAKQHVPVTRRAAPVGALRDYRY